MFKKILACIYLFLFLFLCLLLFLLSRGDFDQLLEAKRDQLKDRLLSYMSGEEPIAPALPPTPSTKPAPTPLKKVFTKTPTPLNPAKKKSKRVIKICAPPPKDAEGIQIENVLYNTITKMDLKSCTKCTKEEKKVILQLKMFKALQSGNTALYKKYSKELDNYVN